MKIKIFVVIFSVLLFYQYVHADKVTFPILKNGKLSNVKLLDVSQIPITILQRNMPNAKDGLGFFFLISRNKNANGLFTLTETKDFLLDEKSYAESSKKSLNIHIEPQTVTEDVNDFFSKIRPDLKSLIILPSDEHSIILMIFIGGKKLPTTGNVEFSIKVGWGKEVESFQYSLNLDSI